MSKKKLDDFQDKNWPMEPGEMFFSGPNRGGTDELRALFLSTETALTLIEANIPKATLDQLVRLAAYDWLKANDSDEQISRENAERKYYGK